MQPLFTTVLGRNDRRRPRAAPFLTACLYAAALAGCGDRASRAPADAGHQEEEAPFSEADVDVPHDFPAAVARVDHYARQIFGAVDAGTDHAAHRPLDEADVVLGKLMSIARDSGVPRAAWEEVNVARREVRAQFDSLHEAIDHGERPDVDTARPLIIAAIARMQAVAATQSSHSPVADLPDRPAAATEERSP